MLAIGDACFRFRAISVVPVILFIFFVFDPLPAGRFNPWLNLLGFLIALAGAVTRFVAVGYAKPFTSGRENYLKAENLNTGGLYSIVRNPLYVGNFLVYNGVLIAYASPAALALFNAFFIPNYYFIILSEENYLEKQFGEVYNEYRRAVPKVLPKFLPLPQERPPVQLDPGHIQGKEHDVLLDLLFRRGHADQAVQAYRRHHRVFLELRRPRPGPVRVEHLLDLDQENRPGIAHGTAIKALVRDKAPSSSTKFQTSTKLQCPIPNEEKLSARISFWSLGFGIWNLFVIWCLVLGI